MTMERAGTAIAEAFVTLRPQVEAFMRETRSALDSLTPQLTAVGRNMSVAITAPLTAAAGAALISFNSVDQGIAQIGRTTGATGDQLRGLSDDFRAVARSGPDGIGPAAEAVALLHQQLDLTGTALQDTARHVLDMARVTGSDLNNVIAQGAVLLQRFNRDASEMPVLLDMLTAASQSAGVASDQLLGILRTYTPVLRNMGMSMEESIAFMATFQAAGIDISRIMPGLNAATRRWASEGITDLTGELEKSIVAIQQAETDAQGLAIATGVLGAEGAQRFTMAVRSGLLDLGDFIDLLSNAEGTVTRTAEETRTLGEDMAQLRTEVALAVEPLGRALVSAFRDLMPLMTSAVGALEGAVAAFASLPQPVQLTAVALAAVAAAAGPLLITIGLMIPAVLSLTPAVASLGVAMAGVFGPVGIAAAATAAVVILLSDMDDLRIAFQAILDPIRQFGKDLGVVGGEVLALSRHVGSLIGELNNLVAVFGVIPSIVGVSTQNTDLFRVAIDSAMNAVMPLKGAINGLASATALWRGEADGAAEATTELSRRQQQAADVEEFLRAARHRGMVATEEATGAAAHYQPALRDLSMEQLRATIIASQYAAEMTGDVQAMEEAALRAQNMLRQVLMVQQGEGSFWQGLLDTAGFNRAFTAAASQAESTVRSVRGLGRAIAATAGEAREAADAFGEMTARQLAAQITTDLMAAGYTDVERALRAVNPEMLAQLRTMQQQEQFASELTDALLGVATANQALSQSLREVAESAVAAFGALTRMVELRDRAMNFDPYEAAMEALGGVIPADWSQADWERHLDEFKRIQEGNSAMFRWTGLIDQFAATGWGTGGTPNTGLLSETWDAAVRLSGAGRGDQSFGRSLSANEFIDQFLGVIQARDRGASGQFLDLASQATLAQAGMTNYGSINIVAPGVTNAEELMRFQDLMVQP